MIKSILYRIYFVLLDLISIPGVFMNKENNAKYHLKVICPICPSCRRKFRDLENNGNCWWEQNWKKGNYKIPRDFGVLNFFRYYLGIKTELKKYKK